MPALGKIVVPALQIICILHVGTFGLNSIPLHQCQCSIATNLELDVWLLIKDRRRLCQSTYGILVCAWIDCAPREDKPKDVASSHAAFCKRRHTIFHQQQQHAPQSHTARVTHIQHGPATHVSPDTMAAHKACNEHVPHGRNMV